MYSRRACSSSFALKGVPVACKLRNENIAKSVASESKRQTAVNQSAGTLHLLPLACLNVINSIVLRSYFEAFLFVVRILIPMSFNDLLHPLQNAFLI